MGLRGGALTRLGDLDVLWIDDGDMEFYAAGARVECSDDLKPGLVGPEL